MEVFVIRHTPVDIAKGICYGQLDVTVDHSVFATYQSHYEAVLPTTITHTFTSPLKRCVLLAEALNRGDLIADVRLMEMNFGKWEGIEWDAIPKEDMINWSNNFVDVCPPEGENLRILYHRVAHFLDELRLLEAQNVLLVVHGGVIRCILGYLLQIPLENLFKIPVNFGELLSFHLDLQPNSDYLTRIH